MKYKTLNTLGNQLKEYFKLDTVEQLGNQISIVFNVCMNVDDVNWLFMFAQRNHLNIHIHSISERVNAVLEYKELA